MRQLATASLLGCVIVCISLTAAASEVARHKNTENNMAKRLNHEQLSGIKREQNFPVAVGSPKSPRLDTRGADIGILFFRGDGGDPNQLRVDDNTLMYITGRTGAGRIYLNGREVEIHPAVKEGVGQIAMQQFLAPVGAPLLIAELPATAQEAATRFTKGLAPKLLFARVTSREDTARVSEKRVTKILALAAALGAAQPKDVVSLVKSAMLVFGFKSDACDTSGDLRCDRPGVREAFAQIKYEEAVQRTLAAH